MIFLLLVTAVTATDVLQSALQSGEAMARLYSRYENEQGRVYSLTENRLRFRLFRRSVQEAAEINSEDLGWEAGLNMFSDMTPQEKGQYLGFNVSLPHATGAPLPLASTGPAADSLDWRTMGGVTPVKNQGRCGSCWTFGAVGSIEGVHFSKTKGLKKFAEQELLDCVYEGKRDGCQGGWMHDCFKYMQDNQRLAPSSAVKYRAKDGACNYSGKKNGLQVAVTGMYEVPKTEDAHLAGLTQGPIAVAFEVTSKCQQYRKGIFKDTSCTGSPNHAVTLVGYTSESLAIKNSWGGSWGDKGYIYMARNHHNCKLYDHSVIISMGDEVKPTVEPEPTKTPPPTATPGPDCKDDWGLQCTINASYLCSVNAYARMCKRTCKLC